MLCSVSVLAVSGATISLHSQPVIKASQQQPDSLQQDSSGYQANHKDSLDEIVPYLDKVEADSSTELILMYMLLIIVTSLMSEDLACIGAGLMAAQGMLEFWPAAIAALSGIFIGDFGLYAAGRLLGQRVFKVRPFSWIISEKTLEGSMKWFNQKGPIILVISRFVPGSRLPVYLSAGLLEISFWKFCLYFGGTALLWTPVFVWLSVLAGNEILAYYDKYDDYALWIMLGILIVLLIMYKLLLPLFTTRGRRIAWKRLKSILGK